MEFRELRWYRFVYRCKKRLRKMTPDDMDYDALKRLVETCHTWEAVDAWVNTYNETYFRILIQSLRDGVTDSECG